MEAGSMGPNLEESPQFIELTTEGKLSRQQLVVDGGPIVQMFIGDAIGDAFGLGIEMEDAFWIRNNVPFPPSAWPESCLVNSASPATRRGMYSDDCEMTVGLAKALMKEGLALDEAGMLQAWKDEWDLAERHRHGHGSVRYYWSGEMSLAEVQHRQAEKLDPGNAPPMRSLPLLFLPETERERLCAANSNTTHPHPRARGASLAIASGAHWLIVTKGDQRLVLSEATSALQRSQLHDEATVRHLESLDALPDWHTFGPRFSKMSGEVHALICGPQPHADLKHLKCGNPPGCVHGLSSDAMRTAGVVLYVLKWHRGPLDALAASIDVGGDVDSTAALVLGIIGGATGLEVDKDGGIPSFLIWELEGVEYLVAQARAFEQWLVSNGLWTR